MKTSLFINRIVGLFVVLFLAGGSLLAQGGNLVLTASSSFSGNGTIKVKKDIVNTGVSVDIPIAGTVQMNGGTQSIGGTTPGTGRIDFATLQASAVGAKTFAVNSHVTAAIDVTGGAGTNFDLGAKTLTLLGTIANTGAGGGAYTFNGAGSLVNYAETGGTPHIWGTTYDQLTISATTAIDLQGDVTANNTISQSGAGALAVNNNLTAGAGYTFGTISNVSSAKTLTLSAAGGSISTLTNNQGTVKNGSGTLTIATLTDNNGTIENSSNNGPITVTNAATNHGTITGGGGLIDFASDLATSTGTVTAGSGGITVGGTTTVNSGQITDATGAVLTFAGNVTNNATPGIALTHNGHAYFRGATFSGTGTYSFGGTSMVTYDGTQAQDVLASSYYDFETQKAFTKTAQGNITVTHSFDNGGFTANDATTLDMLSHTLTLPATKDNTNATVVFGGQTNGFAIANTSAGGTVEYNGVSPTVANQHIAAGGYYSLLLVNSAPKNVNDGEEVDVAQNVTVNHDVTLNVGVSLASAIMSVGQQGLGTGNMTINSNAGGTNPGTVSILGTLNVAGDLTNSGSLSNSGTVTVGW